MNAKVIKMRWNGLIIFTSILWATSCSQRLVDFTVISSKNVPLTENGITFRKADQRVKGIDAKWSILIIPGVPNMKEAIDRAIQKYPGAVALTDGVVYNKGWSVLLFGQNKYVVEGTPLYPEKSENRNSDQSTQSLRMESATNSTTMKVIHTVTNERNLVEVARLYNVSLQDLLRWNNLSSNTLDAGMNITVYIPNP